MKSGIYISLKASIDDLHFPTLRVSETMGYAYSTKIPKTKPKGLASDADYINHMTTQTLSDLGIDHTADTIVGDDFIRGVSGGERKRVSLAEVLST